MQIEGERLDFLEQQGKNIKFQNIIQNEANIENIKISKHFKLVNPLPKFQSVPATPQFFDLAGAYIEYPDLQEPLIKYKGQEGGLFKKFTGFFGRK